MKNIKDKTYTFRHLREIKTVPDMMSEDELKDKLVEAELSRGYIPMSVKFQKVRAFNDRQIEPIQYDTAFCYSAYAGKKIARELYETNGKDIKAMNGGDIIRFPISIYGK